VSDRSGSPEPATPVPAQTSGWGGGFRWVLAASAVSSVGDGVLVAAAPLLAARMTDDATAIAGVRIAALVPWLLFGLVAGVVADRVPRQRLMRLVDLVRAVILAVTALLTAADLAQLWLVYLTVFLLGTGQTLFDSAAQALVPQVVAAERLERANGWLLSAETAGTTFLGPPLAGLLFGWHPASPFALDAVSFAASATLLLGVRTSARAARPAPTVTGVRPVARIAAGIREGLSAIWRDPTLRHMAGMIAAANVATGMAYGVFVLYGTVTLGLSASGYGLLLACEAAGALVAGPLVAQLHRRLGTGLALRTAMLLIAVTQLVMGLTRLVPLAALMLAANGAALMAWGVLAVAFRQRQIPPQLLGRTASAFRLTGLSCQAVGMLLGGVLANAYTVPTPIVVGGILACLAILAPGGLWWPDRTRPS
jgi:Na+/melibiose symporter-like transporter